MPADPRPLDGTETVRWLASPTGRRLLARATTALIDHDELFVAERLRRELGPDRAAAVIGQVDLRQRALAKFEPADAGRLLFTPVGLEQATRGDIAAYRAHTAAERLGGTQTPLLDLGCGIGADLLAFARAGFDCTGLDLDATTAAIGQANVVALGVDDHARVRQGEAAQATATTTGSVVFADPARRDARGRVFDVHGWSPPWPTVLGWLAGTAGVKVGPGIPHRLIPSGVSAEWISVSGADGAPGASAAAGLKEAFLTSGALADPAGRFAATVQAPGGFVSLHGDPAYRAEPGEIGDYLYEPDPAVIRSGLVGELAKMIDGRLLDHDIAYLSADAAHTLPFARGYRIVETVPHRSKPLRALLRARHVGRLTIKKRGVDLDPARLRRALLGSRGYGAAEATLVFTRMHGRTRGTVALLVDPLAALASDH